MLKKSLAILMVVMLSLAMVTGCTGSSNTTTTATTAKTADTTKTAETTMPAETTKAAPAFVPAAEIVPAPGKTLLSLPLDKVSDKPIKIATIMVQNNPFGAAVLVGQNFAKSILSD